MAAVDMKRNSKKLRIVVRRGATKKTESDGIDPSTLRCSAKVTNTLRNSHMLYQLSYDTSFSFFCAHASSYGGKKNTFIIRR